MPKTNQSRRKPIHKQGFTLIELLVVIAIIAILAAIIFPVFASAREKGRQTVCASNLRQLGTAIRLYTDDYDGEMPRTSHNAANAPIVWVLSLAPYIQNAYQIRACPSDPAVDDFTTRDPSVPFNPANPLGKFGTSYAVNEYVAEPHIDAFLGAVEHPDIVTSIDQVPRPSETLMVYEVSASQARDSYWDHGHNLNWFASSNPNVRWRNILDEMEPDQHRGGHVPPVPQVSSAARRTGYDRTKGVSNFLYCDTHVKAVPALQVRSWAFQNHNFCKPPR